MRSAIIEAVRLARQTSISADDIAASLAPSGQAPLEGVKALVWDNDLEAKTGFVVSYQIDLRSDGKTFDVCLDGARIPNGRHLESIEVAKATAQADYEARIRSALLPASAEPVDVLDILAKNVGWELSWGEHDNDLSEVCWRVHRASGGRNDREWTLIGTGDTPRAALNAAIELLGPNRTTEATSAVGHTTQTGEAVPADLPTNGSQSPASGAVDAGWQLVPVAALKWLNGEGPDHNGDWFGDVSGRGNFWWRKHFSDMIAAAPTEGR